ncbi:MAG: hypothetical protein P4L51_26215 [Puia sp.]|nr:hypothetical protein [Puia sp.]
MKATASPTSTPMPALRPLLSGVIGMALLLPATYFLCTLLARILFGARTLYIAIAPSFLQSPFGILSFHLAQAIIYGPLIAVLLNLFATVKVRLEHEGGRWGVRVHLLKGHWLNMAIVFQSGLLFLILVAYTLIQHWRY